MAHCVSLHTLSIGGPLILVPDRGHPFHDARQLNLLCFPSPQAVSGAPGYISKRGPHDLPRPQGTCIIEAVCLSGNKLIPPCLMITGGWPKWIVSRTPHVTG